MLSGSLVAAKLPPFCSMWSFARSETWQLEHTAEFGEITTSSIGEAASAISGGRADRAVAHATSGHCLQQDLVCVLEGE